MHILIETSYGYGLYRIKDKSILDDNSVSISNLTKDNITSYVKLKSFQPFKNSKEAIEEMENLNKSKIGNVLKRALKRQVDSLVVVDKGLATEINTNLNIKVLYKHNSHELAKLIKENSKLLYTDLSVDTTKMALSLSHGMARLKLRFQKDNIDTLIVQSINLLDDIDKDLNLLSMRIREWYGYYFPELSELCVDASLYIKAVKLIKNPATIDETLLRNTLDQEICDKIIATAKITMGMPINDDLEHILSLTDRCVQLQDYRIKLNGYLINRMDKLAPNLAALVGYSIGARLISHAGKLMNLAKNPSSTIQLMGAEKALFRALKTGASTPKYGLIFNASLIGKSNQKNKGKMARMLAAKISLCSRVDALSDNPDNSVGIQCYEYLYRNLNRNVSIHSLIKEPDSIKFDVKLVKKRKLPKESNDAGNPASPDFADRSNIKRKKTKI